MYSNRYQLIYVILIVFADQSVCDSADCDLTTIRHTCYETVSREWPLTNRTDQSPHSICCWHWDVFDCVQLAACEQCSADMSNDIEAEQSRLKQNLMNGTCKDYPFRSFKCHLNIAVYSLCLYAFCFAIAGTYLTFSYWKKCKTQ